VDTNSNRDSSGGGSGDGRNSLLNDIRAGMKLKSVSLNNSVFNICSVYYRL